MALLRSIAARFFPSKKHYCSEPEAGHLQLGRAGEAAAAAFLRRKRFKILRRNFKAPHGGEADLVCRDGRTLVFVEVKTRRQTMHGRPADAVTPQKQQLIAKAALHWLRLLDNPEVSCRFDVVEVLEERDGHLDCTLVRDAFPLPDPWRY